MAIAVRQARKGNAAFTAVSIIALLGFATLTVDIGHARMAKAQIQNAVDAAAHAAVSDINLTDEGIVDARAAAVHVASLNYADGSAIALASSDVVFGEYDWSDGSFTAKESPADEVNAVVVTHNKTDIDAIFALVSFGVSTLGAGAASMAVVPPGSPATAVSCYLPIAVPACAVDGTAAVFNFQTASNGEDSAGWAALPDEDGTSPNADFLKSQLSGSDCQPGAVGDEVSVMNGNVTSAYKAAAKRINYGDDGAGPWTTGGETYTAPDPWPTDQWPTKPASTERVAGSDVDTSVFGEYGIAGPIMLVTSDENDNGIDDFCEDLNNDGEPDNPPNWTGAMDLVGFAYGILYDVDEGNNIQVKVNTEFDFDDYATAGGGTIDSGLVFREPPRLIPPE